MYRFIEHVSYIYATVYLITHVKFNNIPVLISSQTFSVGFDQLVVFYLFPIPRFNISGGPYKFSSLLTMLGCPFMFFIFYNQPFCRWNKRASNCFMWCSISVRQTWSNWRVSDVLHQYLIDIFGMCVRNPLESRRGANTPPPRFLEKFF